MNTTDPYHGQLYPYQYAFLGERRPHAHDANVPAIRTLRNLRTYRNAAIRQKVAALRTLRLNPEMNVEITRGALPVGIDAWPNGRIVGKAKTTGECKLVFSV